MSILFVLPHFGEKQFRSIHNNTSQEIETGFLNRMSLKYYLTLLAAKDLVVTRKLPEWKEDWTTMRIYIWKGSLSLIENNIWVGIGPNSIRQALTNFYEKEGIVYAAESKLNCHNQFLETCLGIGLWGLLFLILLIAVSILYAFKQKNWFFIGFIAFFIILFFVESAFNRIAGIASFSVFFSFFLSYFGLAAYVSKRVNSIN
jgi:O-antigen ligase